MKQWYLFYSSDYDKLAQLGREIHDSLIPGTRSVPFPNYFALIPWKHHVEIVTKSKSIEEALFYVAKTISGNWSRNTLINCIQSDLYHTSGGAITNFSDKLPAPQSELAQAITKDTYDFGFLSLDEGYKEEALETELERQLTRFLLELGKGFAYLGRQVQNVHIKEIQEQLPTIEELIKRIQQLEKELDKKRVQAATKPCRIS